jgi:3',5'-cyclic AMP phosphodiesterase CpdA
MARVVFLSDLHLSPTHGFFWENFRLARDEADAAGAAAVVVNGDLCINGPDSDAEMDFAAHALAAFRTPVLALPGNHDVGDEPPGQDPNQIIDAARLARWNQRFGADHFVRDVGAWRLIGVNAQLFGSGLPEERDQFAWLEDALRHAGGRQRALLLHKPLFLSDANEGPANAGCITPWPRAALLALLQAHGVSLVISGHLHATQDRLVDGIRHLWLPATSFMSDGHAGVPAVGACVIDFGASEALVESLPVTLTPHRLVEIKQHGRYKFLRDMPPYPPPGAEDVLAGSTPTGAI